MIFIIPSPVVHNHSISIFVHTCLKIVRDWHGLCPAGLLRRRIARIYAGLGWLRQLMLVLYPHLPAGRQGFAQIYTDVDGEMEWGRGGVREKSLSISLLLSVTLSLNHLPVSIKLIISYLSLKILLIPRHKSFDAFFNGGVRFVTEVCHEICDISVSAGHIAGLHGQARQWKFAG